jgi:cellulose synthase/poly-beta-1,6-N-acetylglucosamine synthase-like glycosyltransferase
MVGLALVGSTGLATWHFELLANSMITHGEALRAVSLLGFFCLPFYVLACGSFVYLFARYGFCRRLNIEAQPDRAELAFALRSPSKLTILVPSYMEETDIVRLTVMSAALVEHPDRRVVVLVDDPPLPRNPVDLTRLMATRALPAELKDLFSEPAGRFGAELRRFRKRRKRAVFDAQAECRRLALLFTEAAAWLESLAPKFVEMKGVSVPDHTIDLFVEKILREPAANHRQLSGQLEKASECSIEDVLDHYKRLAAMFRVAFSTFERKRFVNLPHAPNKAMNLNAYISLIGKDFKEVSRRDGLHLEACRKSEATLHVQSVDYIMTLDADSLVLSNYAARQILIMERTGNERIALSQTPYLAIPGSPILLERVAGATTDLHYLIHQGLNHYNAAFWVGPNALIRHAALIDIETEFEERGHRMKMYIQDRTVIEDTATTVDLIKKGWRLHSDMARLVYSATPSDFGALIIQRRRWANGGLLVLPALLRHIWRNGLSRANAHESFLRAYTLVAACVGSVSMLALIFYSSGDVSPWLLLAAIPYYILQARDLLRVGYRLTDLPRVYALNLALTPVLIAGTIQSLRQAITGMKSPFKRTPKIAGRTSMPVAYILMTYGLFFYCIRASIDNFELGRIYYAIFAGALASALGYAAIRYLGLQASCEDIWEDVRSRNWHAIPSRLRLSAARALRTPEATLGPQESLPFRTNEATTTHFEDAINEAA